MQPSTLDLCTWSGARHDTCEKCYGSSLPLLAPLQVGGCGPFEHMARVRKPTQDAGTMVRRYVMALEAPTNWHLKVHGYTDQSDFSVPLHQAVRPGDRAALARCRQCEGR